MIDAYRLVKAEVPEVQLALVGSMAHDDPEGWDYYNQTVEYADGDPDIYILSNLNNVGVGRGQRVPGALDGRAPEVDPRGLRPDRQRGALEGAADRRRAASAASSCRSSTARPAGSSTRRGVRRRRAWRSSHDPEAARARALRGKEHVRRHFLTPRLLRDWLVLFNRLSARTRQAQRSRPSRLHTTASGDRLGAMAPPQPDRRLEPRAGDLRARTRTASASHGAAAAASSRRCAASCSTTT